MSLGAIINTATLNPTFSGTFGDGFVSSPDGSTGLWQTSLANRNRTLGGNGEQEYYSDGSVGVNPFSVNNGVLDITATPGSNALGLPYNSGVITTQGSFNQLYGYFEIDAKLPAGQGLWPAFWLLPASGAWPPELDVFEVLGNNPNTLYFSTHSKVQATQGTVLNVPNVSAGFNLYGVMWGPQTVNLYINNIEVASMPTPADMNVPMYMLANLAVGGYWPGNPNSTTPFPATMGIAYVKAFAYPGTTGGTVYDTLPSQNIGAAASAPSISAPSTIQVTSGVAGAVRGVSVAANWPGGNFTVTISDTQGLLQTSTTADVFTSGEGTSTITLTGNLAPIDTALATLTYQASVAGSENIWISATDPQGQQTLLSIVAKNLAQAAPPPPSTIGEAPPAAAAVVNAPASVSVIAGSASALPGLGFTDSQTDGTFTATVSDSTGLLATAASEGVTGTGQNTTRLTLTGGFAAVNAALATLTYQGAASVSSDWLWVSATDPKGVQSLNHTVVTVDPAPAPPPPVVAAAVIAPANVSMTAGLACALSGISIADSQTTGIFTATVSDSKGVLATTVTAGVASTGEDTTRLILTGGIGALNAALASLTYQGASPATDWLWVSANDPQGTQSLNHTVVTVDPPPIPKPAPPVAVATILAPATERFTAGSAGALSGVSVTDSQTTGTMTVMVSDSAGLLSTGVAAGVTAQGEGSAALTLTGSVDAINTDLATLTYQAAAARGADWLWISANTTLGNQVLAHTVVTVTPAPAFAPPVVKTPAGFTIGAGGASLLTGVSVTDSQASPNLSVTVSDSTGLLQTSAVGGVTTQGEATTSLTLTGSAAAIDTGLASLTYRAGASVGTDWLWVSGTDPNGMQGVSPVVVTVQSAPTPPTISLSSVMLGLSDIATFVRATVSDQYGLLATTPQTGISATGEGSASLVLQGIASQVSAELATLTYTGDAGVLSSGSGDHLTVNVQGMTGVHLAISALTLLHGHLATPS